MFNNNTKILGILNITPDSFSDGGKFFTTETAITQAINLIDGGAHIIDIGVESTRPNAIPLSPTEEWIRLKDVISEIITIAHNKKTKVSLDTRYAITAHKAIKLGVNYINDVSGLSDPDMIPVVKDSNAAIIVMHNLGIPANKSNTIPAHYDIIKEITKWLELRIEQLISADISTDRIIIDPGIGFGKTAQQSLYIIKHITHFKALNLPICVGHSRKSMLSALSIDNDFRDYATAIISTFLMQKNIDFIRVHNSYLHTQTFKIWNALL
ncbi:dihydropteroate synthase [Neoehrlichia mikurensis]|uniref:Dihydropteroate synthase n=1 Tax=Neoehrlichia mikurensis TaxID=89586 RepID=A0A9Q9BTH7_9RICK|nr:dihydropteroate synthase [Neoehrlichia mikurensis]QXK91773.1 dihydropteroate synthase [Neoehrlichia mikurensis]QXK92986.1 dihydropteroate synthase [Neoehrlichia mikurensis]QXK93463.1 dihydropteroate synthase [Neoehrlichia mikurensis]UTO55582.1 dihydropteroate synthase [Neoehrlichia mikurensis]UTO56503.1 dihydropteroate synthase [Neoehrlichia mikurensis]